MPDPTFFGRSSNPVDNQANADIPTVVAPLNDMLQGDLVVIEALSNTNNAVLAISETGGQIWTTLDAQFGAAMSTRLFFCVFDGTWTADPSVSFDSGNGFTAVMDVWRPLTTSYTWDVDVAQVRSSYTAPGSPHDVTITEITTLTDGAVVRVTCASIDDNTYSLQGLAYLFPSPSDPNEPISRHIADRWLREAEGRAGLEPQSGSLWHAYRRAWATSRKHLPTADVAAAGGWRDPHTVLGIYQQADPATLLTVVLGGAELREVSR